MPLPSFTSSLGTLASLEDHLDSLEAATKHEAINVPHLRQIDFLRHIQRAISSISGSLLSALSLPPQLWPQDAKALSTPTPASNSAHADQIARLRIRAYGVALVRLLDLSANLDMMLLPLSDHSPSASTDDNHYSTKDLILQIAEDVVVPLIRSIHFLSTTYITDELSKSDSKNPQSTRPPFHY